MKATGTPSWSVGRAMQQTNFKKCWKTEIRTTVLYSGYQYTYFWYIPMYIQYIFYLNTWQRYRCFLLVMTVKLLKKLYETHQDEQYCSWTINDAKSVANFMKCTLYVHNYLHLSIYIMVVLAVSLVVVYWLQWYLSTASLIVCKCLSFWPF